jgi:hypothetical protein
LLRESLGSVKLRELTAGDVQQALDALAGRLSTRTLQILRNCLERAIRHAEVRDLAGRNVAAVVKPPRGTARRPSKSLTLEQAQALLQARKVLHGACRGASVYALPRRGRTIARLAPQGRMCRLMARYRA